MASASGQHPSQMEQSIEYAGSRILQEAAGQHQPNIIGNKEDDSFSDDMDVVPNQANNNSFDRIKDAGSAPQYQKENIFMAGSRISPSKRSGQGKSPSKFTISMSNIPKSYTRSMKRKSDNN